MNILVYLKQDDSLVYLQKIVQLMNLDISVDEAKDDTIFFELYERNIYDIVFVEYCENVWKSIINNILYRNESQKIILVSDTFGCSVSNNCLDCQKKYNVNLVIKPILDIKTSELFLRKIVCEEYENSELQFKLLQLNKQLNLDHGTIKIDLETLTYSFDTLKDHMQILALSDLVFSLNKMNLKYEVFHNFDVKILT